MQMTCEMPTVTGMLMFGERLFPINRNTDEEPFNHLKKSYKRRSVRLEPYADRRFITY